MKNIFSFTSKKEENSPENLPSHINLTSNRPLSKQMSTSPQNMFSRIFKAIDLNDDGKISVEELDCFLDLITVLHKRMKVASDFLKELDGNADESIELDEWMNYSRVKSFKSFDFQNVLVNSFGGVF